MSRHIEDLRLDLEKLLDYYSQYHKYGEEMIRIFDRFVIPTQEKLIQEMNQFIRKKDLTDEEFQTMIPLLKAANQVHNNTQRIREEYILHHPEEFGISTSELRRVKESFERMFDELEYIDDEETYFSAVQEFEEFLRQYLPILRNIPETHPNRVAVDKMITNMEYVLNGLNHLAPIRTTTNPVMY